MNKISYFLVCSVNAIQGIKVLGNEVDFAFGGLMPLSWSRSYYSDGVDIGWLGQGWRVQGCQYIVKEDDSNVIYVDEQERRFSLPPLDKGDKVFFRSELIWVEHTLDQIQVFHIIFVLYTE